eukprot:CAMPEP_0119014478 /NCGR_PEP_ID=MMETSP1176-20130426/9821_1 /TAXON_ID=265551 /ORGANISM="Synedropsis recta cf, Strain CCMP1620" /LENGTH=327 /DNA_ID=CAMNT_0006967667 /DNA_START=10 /DNA_END=993 /DNA_ORIENTATION=-
MTASPAWLVSRSLVMATFYISVMLTIHVRAASDESNSTSSATAELSFRERLQQGPTGLSHWDILLFGGIIYMGFELMSYIALHTGDWVQAKRVPVRGKHLDELSSLDLFFIHLNKMTAFPFAYAFLRYAYFAAPRVAWRLNEFTFCNTVLAIPLLYITYDFFYVILHGALHIKGIYGLIHKHHHHQKAPSRGNVDAVNVHPIEYILGEFNHLLALHIVCTYFVQVHVVTSLVFLVVGGFLASLNHTRHDLVLLGGMVYDSKAHDVHHRIPQSNYGQYTMFWDHVIGSYRAYNPNDRVNPSAQLNLKTGKSMAYHEAQASSAAIKKVE